MGILSLVETERLILKEFKPQDIDFIYRHFSNEDVCRYLFDCEPLTSIEGAKKIIDFYTDSEQSDRNRWCIISKESNKQIGTCGYHRWDKTNNIAEIGYDLERESWGRGYMQEAIGAALKVGFCNMKLNRVQAFTYVQNARSVKMLKKLGFTAEGIIRDKHYFRGTYYDHYCFSLLKREWNRDCI
ncbi:MAG: GNAT family protein [Armatimonadota bacterium]|nr:GNAT family N-acetyltransferase [bacterium]